jgi:hypothetical protein
MGSELNDYSQARQVTAMSLQKLVDSTEQLTYLSLPERTALVEEISRVVPAGNVPSMVAAGLANLPDRVVSVADSRRNLNLLMQGMQTFLDKAVYKTFFAGPAAVLSAYQMLLKLTGKDVDSSFPEGTWQFYVEFGLREDTGRHVCETVGFQTALQRESLKLTSADEMAAWLTAISWLLDCYSDLLRNEWTERTKLRIMAEVFEDNGLVGRWLKVRPYAAPANVNMEFTAYRRQAFELFCKTELEKDDRKRKRFDNIWNEKTAAEKRVSEVKAYQRQMTIQAALNPGEHSDQRVFIPRENLALAVIANARYYLIDCPQIMAIEEMRPAAAGLLRDKPIVPPATLDKLLCNIYRRDQAAIRRILPDSTRLELDQLHLAPIILNWDLAQSDQLLADIRSGRRGIGDHALTIFRCSNSTIFDMSHIFFDGAWGIATAEILTGQAIRYARMLAGLPKSTTMPKATMLPEVRRLALEAPAGLAAQIRKSQIPPEVSGETTRVNLEYLQRARRSLQARNDKLHLTVNDMLILYRSVFGPLYKPSLDVLHALADLDNGGDGKQKAASALARASIEAAQQLNPALLIPIDASNVSPRERVFPTTFRNLFPNLIDQHREALAAWERLQSAGLLIRHTAHRQFEEARRDYLGTLYAFAQLTRRYKDVSLKGESISTSSIKLLGGLPQSVQRLLDGLPGHFDVLNDIIKGQEVFSNVGQVSPMSSLTRFNTAKDDNEKKVLAWGVMTDAEGRLRISLRDSRPHVAALIGVKHGALAQKITQEFVDAYAKGLNNYCEELSHIARAGRNTGTLSGAGTQG